MGSTVSNGYVINKEEKGIIIVERFSIEGDRIRNGEDSKYIRYQDKETQGRIGSR